MIEKLEKHIIGENAPGTVPLMVAPTAEQQVDKINELCDAVNAIQKEREAERFEIQEWIGILEAVRKSVNVHEKQIDELQMKHEPEKCETPAENVPEPIKLYVCADGSVYDNEDVAKSHAAGELARTRRALGIAMGFIEKVRNNEDTHMFWIKVANDTINKITALEQKD